jgi:hypothetical protein
MLSLSNHGAGRAPVTAELIEAFSEAVQPKRSAAAAE